MEITKVQLPPITIESYDYLKKSLIYYRNSGVEFSKDGDFLIDMNTLIENIEYRVEIIKS